MPNNELAVLPKDETYFENAHKVVALYLQGETETAIAKRMSLKRKDVLVYIKDWKESSTVQTEMKERVNELIQGLDTHYTILIKKQYEIVDACDSYPTPNHQILAQKNAALKAIADLEDKRIGVLQRSGLLDNEELGAELAEMERQRELILEILKNDLCEKCTPVVRGRIGEVLSKPQPIVIYDE